MNQIRVESLASGEDEESYEIRLLLLALENSSYR